MSDTFNIMPLLFNRDGVYRRSTSSAGSNSAAATDVRMYNKPRYQLTNVISVINILPGMLCFYRASNRRRRRGSKQTMFYLARICVYSRAMSADDEGGQRRVSRRTHHAVFAVEKYSSKYSLYQLRIANENRECTSLINAREREFNIQVD